MASFKSASLDDIRKFAARVGRDFLSGRWKTVSEDEVIARRISGGLSNFLYYIGLPMDGSANTDTSKNNLNLNMSSVDGIEAKKFKYGDEDTEPREVLLRIYGQTHGESELEAMITESVVFALLSERNLGPKLHGVFPGGRIEQFIPARPLCTKEMALPEISKKIAEKMGEIHTLNIPISKEPRWLWDSMERWLRGADEILGKSESSIGNEVFEDWKEVRAFKYLDELKWLQGVVDGTNLPVVFCHNDMQEGNILLRQPSPTRKGLDERDSISEAMNNNLNLSKMERSNKLFNIPGRSCEATMIEPLGNDDPDLFIIDFEYCAYNYRGFDLANHFLEWTIDYSYDTYPFYRHNPSLYPSPHQRKIFIQSYLKKLNSATGSEDYVPATEEIDKVDGELNVCCMLSHIFWSLWSIVNINSNIEFGYWKYAVTRISEYQRLKREYLKMTNGESI